MIEVLCRGCKTWSKFPDKHINKTVACPECGNPVLVAENVLIDAPSSPKQGWIIGLLAVIATCSVLEIAWKIGVAVEVNKRVESINEKLKK